MKISIRQLIRNLAMKGSRVTSGLILIFGLLVHGASAQQYVDNTTVTENDELTADAEVTGKDNALGAPGGGVATISVEGLTVNILGETINVASDGALNMNFNPGISGGVTTYVRITDFTTNIVGLDLDQIVGLLGLLDNSAITATSNGGPTTSKLVRDPSGALFLAVTPSGAYTRVSVGLDFAGIGTVAVGQVSMDIDHAVAYTNTTFVPCESVTRFTNAGAESNGISVALTNALVNPERAIDGSMETYSVLKASEVSAVAGTSQVIRFTKTLPGTTEIVATLSKIGLLADVTLLSNIRIQARLGNTRVGTARTLQSLLLGLTLLDFDNLQPATVAFAPGVTFDGVEIIIEGVANVLNSLNIHEVSARSPIIFTGGDLQVYDAGDNININISSATAYALDPLYPMYPAQPGFTIACGTSTDYTYRLKDVTLVNARTTAGTLPNTLTLSLAGVLSGNAAETQVGVYFFDVEARNAFGQTAVTTFKITIEPSLPVTLVSFKASSEGPTALLSWSTASETNSDRFDIERSQNGKKWEKIGSVKSNHESVTQHFYSFQDAQPLDGENLYRLKMVDLDETFAYSHIENLKFASTAFLYPNPVRNTENLNLNLTDWSKVKQVKVVNALGKTVFEASNALSTGISTRNLNSGTYVVQVIHTNGTISAHRFVRQ
ncbi:T9SS type A sorting domain-containing protein [Dyadobacter chenwenxiniae]|uniref:T9SS type A sorting domain-containing protein n=1 Tax=Dyadobacter chenwenxiniae TaxID=2906456 RepID=A0A9X1PQ47_9BACT|nr:T9SS type A sorting domain-containing protein [Dyadobacter chenwenxiniae]MCF0063633.1 T9SS type A sorting domain-containing protein [Dyadobacter chenwenxiniae]UON83309.1 T9SS type A sorting domain-containing protein [Dyadobacter chenwenxiniae]